MSAAATQEPISRDIALRIGLAAKVLPDTTPRRLLELLIEKLGLPLTEEKLAHVTVTQLKTGLASPDGEEDTEHVTTVAISDYKEAVRYLWGEVGAENNLPPIEAYADGEMPGSIRIALASNDAENCDGHFGSCMRFLVYQADQNQMRLIDIRSTVGADESDDRNQFRTDLIKDCQVLYVVSIGGPAAAKVVKAGIYPIKLNAEEPAREVIAKLQGVLAGSPPPWLAKIMGKKPELRSNFDQDEDWEEQA
jgi:nitrogen fixation protein NifX